MVRVDVLAYTPTDFVEEKDVTIGRCRDLTEKFSVTWVNIVDLDGKTQEELEAAFGLHPLAVEDAQNENLSARVEVYDETVFIVARAILWAEEIDTHRLAMFVAKNFVVTIHNQSLPQLEDVRIRLRKRNPQMVKSGADFLAYEILDALVESYFPHLDRLQSLLDELEEEIIDRPSGKGLSRLHELRTDIVRLRRGLGAQREMFGALGRLEVPTFKTETRMYLRDVQDHMIGALDTLDADREITASLMDFQATLAANQVNDVIKVLTVIFTVTLPIAIVTSAFGMNVPFFGFGRPEGLYLALVLMAVPTVVLAAWMHRKGWI
jgi:magnesium transporter